MNALAKYPATISGVKRGLKRVRATQTEAAGATNQSQALISLVLAGKVTSQPCLDKLSGFINGRLAEGRQREGEVA